MRKCDVNNAKMNTNHTSQTKSLDLIRLIVLKARILAANFFSITGHNIVVQLLPISLFSIIFIITLFQIKSIMDVMGSPRSSMIQELKLLATIELKSPYLYLGK